MANLVLYNTLMGLAASIALLLLVVFPHYGARAPVDVRRAWAWTFGGLGGLLVIMGLHVNFVWPLLGVANIVFGEPSLLFGVLLVVAAVIIHRTPVSNDDESIESVEEAETSWRRVWAGAGLPPELAVALRPVGYVGGAAGVMVILLGWATAAFGTIVFRAPPNEWPTGLVAGTGLEVAYMTAIHDSRPRSHLPPRWPSRSRSPQDGRSPPRDRRAAHLVHHARELRRPRLPRGRCPAGRHPVATGINCL